MNLIKDKYVKNISTNIYKNMTYTQKWEEFLKLRKLAWEIKCAAIKKVHPDYTDDQVEQAVTEIFLYASG